MTVKKLSKEERKAGLKHRTEQNAHDREGGGGSRLLNLSGYDKVKFFQPKKGTLHIDHIPFIAQTDLFAHKGIKAGMEDYLLDIWAHTYVGAGKESFVCPRKTFNKPCPICEEAFKLQEEGVDKKTLKGLWPKRICFYNVIDADDEDAGIQIFQRPHFLYEKELLEEAEAGDEIVTFADLDDGKTVQCRASEDKIEGGQQFLRFKSFSFKGREPFDESILDETYPLDKMLIISSYDEIRDAYYGADDDSSSDDGGDEGHSEEKPAAEEKEKPARSFKRGGSKPAAEEKDEEKPSKPAGKNKCPHGHKFGADVDKFKDDCSECEVWEACADASD